MRLEAGDAVRADERVVDRAGRQLEAIADGEVHGLAAARQPEPDRAGGSTTITLS